ncbi:MAG TPA: hypothetical protein VHI52_09360 [Verrucomicrobiae bacterium]|nr:hypothetical protein [Verrucomicrobiae bacterium]
MKTGNTSLALLQLGGGEIVLIAILLLVLTVVALTVVGVVYLIVRALQKPSPPVVATVSPEVLTESHRLRDQEHLKLLSIFHFVFAGLALLGIAFLAVHYAMMHTFFSHPEMWKTPNGVAPPPKEFLEGFVWLYVFMGIIILVGFAVNLMSGLFIRQRRHRVFSLVIAALDCLQIPFGTALGVFTIVVLSRESIRGLYASDAL